MAIAINGTPVTALRTANSGTTTFSLTINSSLSNSILIVSFSSGIGNASGVTWNGTSMTAGTAITTVQSYMNYFYLVNPEAGTHNIVVSHSSHNSTRAGIVASVFTGVNQTTPINVLANGSNTSNNPSTAITTITDDCMLLEWMSNYKDGSNVATETTGSGQTEIANFYSSNNDELYTSSYKLVGNAGNYSMSASLSRSVSWQMAVIALNPFIPITTNASFLLLMI